MAKKLFVALLVAAFLPALASAQTPPSNADHVGGVVKILGQSARTKTAMLTVWQPRTKGGEHAAFQLRADTDVWQFSLTREQVAGFIAAIRKYQLIERQLGSDAEAGGDLYRTAVKLGRVGGEANADTLVVSMERKGRQKAALFLSFDSWQVPGHPYNGATFRYESALGLREILEELR